MPPDRLLGQARLDGREAYRNLIEATKVAETCCRQLALEEQDPHWILAASGFEAKRELIAKLMRRRRERLVHPWIAN